MISKKMEERLNQQLNAELGAAHSYLAMAAYCDSIDMYGCAHWLKAQAKEELEHAMKFYHYIEEQDATIKITALPEPKCTYSSLQEVFETSLKQEKHVTALINAIVDFAISEKDHATQVFLEWFITEQVEEESSIIDLLHKLKLLKDSGEGLFLFNEELAKRKED
jgi:ferritin